jgi:hypothetical protein
MHPEDIKNPGNTEAGHVSEWQDRARVILDMKKEVTAPASPKQSPSEEEPTEDVEEKSPDIERRKDDTPY